MRRILSTIGLLFVVAACPAHEPKPRLGLRLEPPWPEVEVGKSLTARVTLTNRTNQPLLVCREDWSTPTGIVVFRAFSDGRGVPTREGRLESDYLVSEDRHLALLEPGKSLTGALDVDLRDRFRMPPGEYEIEAEYFCQFTGVRRLGDREVPIESAPYRSNRVRLNVR